MIIKTIILTIFFFIISIKIYNKWKDYNIYNNVINSINKWKFYDYDIDNSNTIKHQIIINDISKSYLVNLFKKKKNTAWFYIFRDEIKENLKDKFENEIVNFLKRNYYKFNVITYSCDKKCKLYCYRFFPTYQLNHEEYNYFKKHIYIYKHNNTFYCDIDDPRTIVFIFNKYNYHFRFSFFKYYTYQNKFIILIPGFRYAIEMDVHI